MNVLRYCHEWHSSIPTHSVLRNETLSPTARLLWCVLQSFASPDAPMPFPSHQTLMKCLWLKRTRLHFYQNELLKAGFLEIEKQRRKGGRWSSNVYVLKVPADHVHSTEHGKSYRVHSTESRGMESAVVDTAGVNIEGVPANRRTSSRKKKNQNNGTTTTAAAPAGRNRHCSISPSQSESLNRAIQFEELPIDEQLTQVWQAKYRRWYGTDYRVKGADALSIDEFCSGGPSQQDMTTLMHAAMAAWVDIAKAPVRPVANQHDHYFYRRRSDKLGFVIRNLVSLQAEMEQAPVTMYGEPVVGTIVLQGKQAYLANGS